MAGIGLALLTFAVFAALTFLAITAALKSPRVDTVINEVFSPWPEGEPARPDGRLAKSDRPMVRRPPGPRPLQETGAE